MNIITPFILGFFLLGIGWGFWSQKNQQHQMAKAAPLRVLCAENWISQAVLEKFSREHKIPVQLFTYNKPSEFLRQMANADGRIDVVCTSSLLLKSLVHSHWLMKTDFSDVPNRQLVSVDFLHLPYDLNGEYSVPLFWNLYGFFGKSKGDADDTTWKQTWNSKRVTIWGEELNLLHILERVGIQVEQRLEEEGEPKGLQEDVREFAHKAAQILKPDLAPVSAEVMFAKADWVMLPLGRVARLLGEKSPYQFWLPEDGAAIEVGLLTIGAKASQPELAKELIGELLTTEHALYVHRTLGTGVVHTTLSSLDSVAPLQKAEALRRFPLNRFEFPDVNVEALPRFQKMFDEAVALDRNRGRQ